MRNSFIDFDSSVFDVLLRLDVVRPVLAQWRRWTTGFVPLLRRGDEADDELSLRD